MTPGISYVDLGIASVLVLISVALSLAEQLGLARDILVSCLRAFVQLTAVGVILSAIFRNVHVVWVVLIVVVMIAIAVQAGGSRVDAHVPALFLNLAIAISVTALVTLAVVIGAVVRPDLWYEPQVVIPLAGMIVGNTMTSAALAVNHFATELRNRQDDVEALLGLGATSDQAVAEVVRSSIRASLIPSVAGMMVVGIVTLPGMMTGQILAGQDPTQAVRYQIVVQYMLFFAAVFTASMIVRLTRRRYFTEAHQLRRNLLLLRPENNGRQAIRSLARQLRGRRSGA